MTLIEVRVRARPASTRSRMVAWSRAAWASEPNSSPRRWAWCSAASTKAATTRSQVGSATSSAKARSAGARRSDSRRTANVATSARIGNGATVAVATMACSRPAAPAMVSRSISDHPATASIRPTASPRPFAPVSSPGAPHPARPAHRAPTGQRVAAPTTTAAPTASPSRSVARSALGRPTDLTGRGSSTPRRPATMTTKPRPTIVPQRPASAVTAPTSPGADPAGRGRSRPRRAGRGCHYVAELRGRPGRRGRDGRPRWRPPSVPRHRRPRGQRR